LKYAIRVYKISRRKYIAASEFMKSVEEFMRHYFDEQVIEEKREQVSRAPFRRKFYADGCYFDSRAGSVELIQSEKVLMVSSSETKAEVITARESPFIPNSLHQLRYHLQVNDDGWQIREVDMWCPACHGEKGKDNCIFCHGTGWRERKTSKPG